MAWEGSYFMTEVEEGKWVLTDSIPDISSKAKSILTAQLEQCMPDSFKVSDLIFELAVSFLILLRRADFSLLNIWI